MKTLTSLLALALLTGCLMVDHKQAQATAFMHLSGDGYDLSGIDVNPKLIFKDSIKEVSAEYFMLSGRYKTIPGFYSSSDRSIYLYKYCNRKAATHEYMHDILFQLGIPINKHHDIINRF